MRSDSLREKPKQTVRIMSAVAAVIEAIVIFALSSIPGSGFSDHPEFLNVIAHFLEYLVLAFLLTLAVNSPDRKLWLAGLLAVVLASLYGVTDEFHQLFVAGRNSDPMDWLVDTAGAMTGAITAVWFISARAVKRSRNRDRLI
jgi:VanZ family protein